MRIILQEQRELIEVKLPKEVNGNYWVKSSSKDNLVNIVSIDNKWVLKSNNAVKILKGINYKENELLTNINQLQSVVLEDFLSFYIMELETKIIRKIFCIPTFDNTMIQLIIDFTKVKDIIIGKSKGCMLCYSDDVIADKQVSLTFKDSSCILKNENIKIPLFINNILESEKNLYSGDIVFIDGLVFCLVGNILLISNPNKKLYYDSLKFAKRILPNNTVKDYSCVQESFVEVFNRSDYFQRPPRFKRIIEEKEYNIDPPTQSQLKEDEMPLVYTMGPMMLMGITSVMSGFTAITNVISGKATFKDNATPIITSIAMLGGMIVFPFMQKMWTKANNIKKENRRKRRYKKYIEEKKSIISNEIEIQKQILIENNVDLISVANIIINKQRTLWDRKIEHEDFLNIRLGIGSVKPKIKINYPEEHFSLEDNNLDDVYKDLFTAVKDIDDVPVTINLINKRIVGVVGNYSFVKTFLNGVMLQLLAFHSYDMLKIVIISSKEKRGTWEKYKNIPHFWNNEKSFRYIGIESEDINKVSNNLMQILNERLGTIEDNKEQKENDLYKGFKEYYLIISDELDYLKNTSIFNELIKLKKNLGFSMLLITEVLDQLPNECSNFVNIEHNNCGVFENELASAKQELFKPDIANFNMNLCYSKLCNIPVDIDAGKFSLPKSYSFLEMYDVGNVNQLNIINRWKNNTILQSLAAPVGINEQGELFKIDLHEKAHGPHGLVAGMTGSGKSEWIITYILSMCVNYHPDEVQFVLIDYKGGGLAGTFENKETGIKIPHLAGTITNLDVSEINRSLASINSELKRRQSLFNAARDKLGESSVDIYKYQKWYRENKITEPISHLFIISDEFAELKSQQPEFMAELISTARIGRSLGVHLILATQKPNGVVDDQIWSNSKFRVCLKVQDKSDSNDMIRVPDAAMLKEAGRFYLQVGYNEFFAKGQSAYAGGPYYESDMHKKTVDTNISFVDNVGEVYKDINSDKKMVSAVFKGEELPNILKEIISCSKQLPNHVKQMWLDAIPSDIYIDELLKKYKYTKENFIINPIIGEYDAPQYQMQALLTLPITNGGNTIIYGISGSGKEKLLTTMLYSLTITYFYQEVNVYILDFGAEVLTAFKKSPIVGDIVTAIEEDKVADYYKFIFGEFGNRKELFQKYNGDYLSYIKKSGKTLPTIITIINNFDNYQEICGERYEDDLSKITREAEKVGIHFIITATAENSVRFKLSQNFKQVLCLQMKDTYNYKTLLGNNIKTIPASIKGRGLSLVNGECFEFQTADPVKTEDLNDYLIKVCNDISSKQNGRAKAITTLPKKVNYEFVKDYVDKLSNLPIAINTESLEVEQYNFIGNKANVVLSNDTDLIKSFISSMVNIISIKKDTLKAIVFDGNSQFDEFKSNVTYIKDGFLGRLKSFDIFLTKINDETKQSLIIFVGLKTILSDAGATELLKSIMEKVSKIDKINVVFADDINTMNSYSNDDYFVNFVNKQNGIYLGSGIMEQYLIGVKSTSMELRQEIPSNFGYIIEKGKTRKVKVIEVSSDEVK